MVAILNLTQHVASGEQRDAGVYDPIPSVQAEVSRLLTFDHLPTEGEIAFRARELARVATNHDVLHVMIGGAPYLMGPLVEALATEWPPIQALFAFSQRESIEEVLPDGSTRKTAVFRHKGFVPA